MFFFRAWIKKKENVFFLACPLLSLRARTVCWENPEGRYARTHAMTIDSGWVRVMKEEVPEAFRSSYPFKGGSPKVAYIDGMPLLMISERNVQCWDDLLRNNFARHIQRYFRLGCRAVVLAFDDYDRVPMSKAITQVPDFFFCIGAGRPCSV